MKGGGRWQNFRHGMLLPVSCVSSSCFLLFHQLGLVLHCALISKPTNWVPGASQGQESTRLESTSKVHVTCP